MKKKIITLILLIGMLGGAIGFYMFNKPLPSMSALRTDFKMSPKELVDVFESNEDSANSKFLDKVIEVTGIVQKVEVDNEITTIYIDADNAMSSVIFQLEDPKSNIAKGEEVTLKGICTGYLMDVVLVRAVKV